MWTGNKELGNYGLNQLEKLPLVGNGRHEYKFAIYGYTIDTQGKRDWKQCILIHDIRASPDLCTTATWHIRHNSLVESRHIHSEMEMYGPGALNLTEHA